MLALTFSDGDLAFVFSEGHPIGAVRVGEFNGSNRVKVHFGGDARAFEVLRANVVERRFGKDALVKLINQFLS
jgi:hypothetical protein